MGSPRSRPTVPATSIWRPAAGSIHAQSPPGSTALPRSRSSCSARGATPSRAGKARSSSSLLQTGGFAQHGDASILDYPDALPRAWAALANPNAGEILVSAAEGYEFADIGGGHHVGGGSHGSLVAGDTEVPLLTVGVERVAGLAPVRSIVEVAPLVLAHFGVTAPAYSLGRAA